MKLGYSLLLSSNSCGMGGDGLLLLLLLQTATWKRNTLHIGRAMHLLFSGGKAKKQLLGAKHDTQNEATCEIGLLI